MMEKEHKGKVRDTSADESIAFLYKNGYSMNQIAPLVHKSHSTIQLALIKMGLISPARRRKEVKFTIGTEVPPIEKTTSNKPIGIALIRGLIEYNRKSLRLIEAELDKLEKQNKKE